MSPAEFHHPLFFVELNLDPRSLQRHQYESNTIGRRLERLYNSSMSHAMILVC